MGTRTEHSAGLNAWARPAADGDSATVEPTGTARPQTPDPVAAGAVAVAAARPVAEAAIPAAGLVAEAGTRTARGDEPVAEPSRRRPAQPRWRVAANLVASVAVIVLSVVSAPWVLAGFVIAALIAGSLEVLVPLHDRRRPLRACVTDLTEALGNRCLIIPAVTAGVAVAAPAVVWLTPDAVPQAVDELAWPLRLSVVLLSVDLASYLAHRALHRVPALWRLHQVHHSSDHVDWLATSRGHALDQAFGLLVMSIPALALGAPTEGGVVITLLYVYPFVLHANAHIRLSGLERVVVSPRFHHWHHAEDAAGHDRNFGTALALWDRLFGTVARVDGFPDRYGIANPQLAHGDFLTHLTAPFRPVSGRRCA
jgi:sterol desaturase/sphingolipid hydroxylase (fatty acid hydroxylase superfamily)